MISLSNEFGFVATAKYAYANVVCLSYLLHIFANIELTDVSVIGKQCGPSTLFAQEASRYNSADNLCCDWPFKDLIELQFQCFAMSM